MSDARPSDVHTAAARVFFRSLAACGVEHVVVSPGSRSTPLAIAAANEPRLTVTSVIDERSAAFFALGQARVTGRPSVLVATSGSAGAHHLPAIIEANEAGVPLVTVTADRPWDLQFAGASQTTDQRKLFGDHVRVALDLGVPDAPGLRAVPRVAARAVLEATGARPGPVHVNAAFRKPLEPITGPREPWSDEADAIVPPRVFAARAVASADAIDAVTEELSRASRPILVAGPSDGLGGGSAAARALARAVADFATRWRVPVFAEPTSGLRYGAAVSCASSLDTMLRTGALGVEPPDLVLQIGLVPVARSFEALAAGARRVVFARWGTPDPFGSAEAIVLGDPADALGRLAARAPSSPVWARFAARVVARDAVIDAAAARVAREWSEAAIARGVVAARERGGALLVGNSLAPRDLDAFGGTSSSDLTVLHQRGAAGIDGLVAGAAGARSVVDPERPVVVVLGDVSALHDLGSFALLREATAALVVVVVDNGGGRIFEALPLAKDVAQRGHLERLFVTPRPPCAAAVARALGARGLVVDAASAFAAELASALRHPGATVLECRVDGAIGHACRARLTADAERAAAEVP